MRLRIYLISLVLKCAFSEHRCSHDEQQEELIVSPKIESSLEETRHHELLLRRQHKQGNWKNIRVLVDYSNWHHQTYNGFLVERLIPSALSFVESVYEVYPKDSITEIQGQAKCGRLKIPPEHQQRGVTGYDLVIYAAAVFEAKSTWVARAVSCILDAKTQRPVAGRLMFNLKYVQNLSQPLSNDEWGEWVQTTIHEMTHIMGFSIRLFPYYVDDRNHPLPVNEVVQLQDSKLWIILPNVVTAARAYFGCPTLWGVPLENDGAQGTAGSHWERTAFGNEAMTGSTCPLSVFSIFTLKLLEGSGWYIADYNYAQTYVWGKNEGCSIPTDLCPTNQLEYCNYTTTIDKCGVDYMAPAYCVSKDPLAEGCNYWKDIIGFDCRFKTNHTFDAQFNATGSVFGPQSRCWNTQFAVSSGYLKNEASCFISQCVDKGVTFQVKNNTYLCSQSQQIINITVNNITFITQCPEIDRFCAYNNNCQNNCSGRGQCINRSCLCHAGFKGSDCSIQC